jgi:hypothetical protein
MMFNTEVRDQALGWLSLGLEAWTISFSVDTFVLGYSWRNSFKISRQNLNYIQTQQERTLLRGGMMQIQTPPTFQHKLDDEPHSLKTVWQ